MGLTALVTKATIRRLGLSYASCDIKSYQCHGSYSLHFQPCYQYYTYCLSVITCSPGKAGQGICLTHTNWPTGCVCKVFILLLFPRKHGDFRSEFARSMQSAVYYISTIYVQTLTIIEQLRYINAPTNLLRVAFIRLHLYGFQSFTVYIYLYIYIIYIAS